MRKYYNSEERKRINNERFFNHILKNTSIPTIDIAHEYFCHLEEQYKNIIIIRWGLDGTHRCGSDAMLIKKTKNPDAPALYKEASEAFNMQVYAEMLTDCATFSPKYAAALGAIAANAIYQKKCKDIFINKAFHGKPLYDFLQNLEDNIYNVLKIKYGLDGSGQKTLQEVANILNLTPERIRQIEKEGLKIVKNVQKLFIY